MLKTTSQISFLVKAKVWSMWRNTNDKTFIRLAHYHWQRRCSWPESGETLSHDSKVGQAFSNWQNGSTGFKTTQKPLIWRDIYCIHAKNSSTSKCFPKSRRRQNTVLPPLFKVGWKCLLTHRLLRPDWAYNIYGCFMIQYQ